MKNLLTREQLYLITEKAVDWNKSALGILTKAAFSPLAWLTGSIKQGLKKKQMTSFVMQWGIEYVTAIKAFDTGEDVKQTSDEETDGFDPGNAETDVVQPDTEEKLNADLIKKQLEILNKESTEITTISTLTKNLSSIIKNSKNEDFTKLKTNIEAQDNYNVLTILKVLPLVTNYDSKTFKISFDKIDNFISNILNASDISNFLTTAKISKENNFDHLYSTLTTDFTNVLNGYKAGITFLSKPKDETKPEDNKTTNTGTETKPAETKPEDNKTTNTNTSTNTSSTTKPGSNESLIKEAAQYKLPTNVTDLMSKEDLLKFENIPDIKKNTLEKINFIRLDAIKYEAQYLLSKSKTAGTKEQPGETDADLKKVWDIGIKNVNDLFQKVIDIPQVLKKIPADLNTQAKVDDATEKAIKQNEDNIDGLQKMGITETIPDGTKFDINKLYAFDCTIMGQNNKSLSTTLFMTPTNQFVEKLDNNTFYWFKILGGYKYDDKTKKITRLNIFSTITPNKKIINNFEQVESSYYIALRNLRPTNTQGYVWIYSNTGKFFFNNEIIDDVDSVKDKIDSYKKDKFADTIKNIANASNIFRLKVNQRFNIDQANVKDNKYPGIQEKDLTNDSGFKTAKGNHDKFINIIK